MAWTIIYLNLLWGFPHPSFLFFYAFVFTRIPLRRRSYEFQCISVIVLLSVSVNVYVPKDRVTNLHQGYGFVEFRSEEDADYVSCTLIVCGTTSALYILLTVAWIRVHIGFRSLFPAFFWHYLSVVLFSFAMQAIKVLNMIKLYGKPIRVNKVS